MDDITFCGGGDCPLKNNCMRYRGRPSVRIKCKDEPTIFHSYFVYPPFNEEANDCEDYLSIERFPQCKIKRSRRMNDEDEIVARPLNSPYSSVTIEINDKIMIMFSKDGIKCFRENFPDWKADDFAEEFLKVLGKNYDVHFTRRGS